MQERSFGRRHDDYDPRVVRCCLVVLFAFGCLGWLL
jgi:hypothetical protein